MSPMIFRHRFALAVLLLFTSAPFLRAQYIEKVEVNMAYVEEQARIASLTPWEPAKDESQLPEALRGLNYDQTRNIRFKPSKRLWGQEHLPFQLALFHLGGFFRDPIMVYEFTPTHKAQVRYSREFFDYTGSGVDDARLPADLGFAGIRFHYPLNKPDFYDELGVFQGASYYRMLGREQIYGLSSRGLALDTAMDKPEEFPVFTRFWVAKPQPGDKSTRLFALLNSPSVAGAYQFRITPGTDTVVEVDQTLYFRRLPESIGMAVLTSMYWFGENSRKPFDDMRPEVHDSDGLAMRMGSGEFLWRPLHNNPGKKGYYSFQAPSVKGFGLLQRDRDFRNYQDLEALYHRRPGLWIEPKGDWGDGVVRLIELPTTNELMDNIVAYWDPAAKPVVGEPHRLGYTQRWTSEQNPGRAGGYVVATRSGIHDWAPGERYATVDFTGDNLFNLPPEVNLVAVVSTDNRAVEALDAQVIRNHFENTWRVSFRLKCQEGMARPEQVEVRCFIKHGENVLTETWSSLMPL